MIGMHMHIDSQIRITASYRGAVARGDDVVCRLREMGDSIAWGEMGGRFGINDQGDEDRSIAELVEVTLPGIQASNSCSAMEPGRAIAGNAGTLVSRVLYTKQSGEKRFLIQGRREEGPDPAVGLRIGPRILPVTVPVRPSRRLRGRDRGDRAPDVVGPVPVGESGDFLAKDRVLPRLDRDDLLATFSAGASGMVMASNDNTRPRAAEILVDGADAHLIHTAKPMRIWSSRSAL